MTQRRYWVLKMRDGREFQLNEAEFSLFKEAKIAEVKMVFYEKFAVNTMDVVWSERKIETLDNYPVLPELSVEEKKKSNKKLDEIRKRWKK